MPKEGPCPRCGEKEIGTVLTPHRAGTKKNKKGDHRRDECGFCGWWSEATYNGRDWVWVTARPMKEYEWAQLDRRLRKLKMKRQKERYGKR